MFYLSPELIVSTWKKVVAEQSCTYNTRELTDSVGEQIDVSAETGDRSWLGEEDDVLDDSSEYDMDDGPIKMEGLCLNRIPGIRIYSPKENGDKDFHEPAILPEKHMFKYGFEDQKLLPIVEKSKGNFNLETRKQISCLGDATCNANRPGCKTYGTFQETREELSQQSELKNIDCPDGYPENVNGAYPKVRRFGSPIASGPPTNIFNRFGTYSNMARSIDSTRKGKCFKYIADIQKLIECDAPLVCDDLVDFKAFFGKSVEVIGASLCALGDKMIIKLEEWVDRLPILYDIPVEVYSNVLSERWFELTVLITTASVAFQGTALKGVPSERLYEEFLRQMKITMKCLFQTRHLRFETETQIEKIMEIVTEIIYTFVRVGVTREDLVCMKMILLFTQGKDNIQLSAKKGHNHYSAILFRHNADRYPNQVFRYRVRQLRLISTAANIILQSKMVYFPFLIRRLAEL